MFMCLWVSTRWTGKRVVQRSTAFHLVCQYSQYPLQNHMYIQFSIYKYISGEQLTGALNCGLFSLNNISSIGKPQRDLSVHFFRKRIFMFSFSSFISPSLPCTLPCSQFLFHILLLCSCHTDPVQYCSLPCLLTASYIFSGVVCLFHVLSYGCYHSMSYYLSLHTHSCFCSFSFPCLHDLSYTHSLSHLCSWILILFLSPVHCISLSLLFSHSSQTYCI